MSDIPIIYQNDEIIIINKRRGLSVQGGKNISHSVDTILPKQLGFPVFLVHRLDKETCGLMIVAKNPFAAKKWTNQIKDGKVKKEYEAICLGAFEKKSGTITEDIIQHGVKKTALTVYNVLEEKDVVLPNDEHIILSHVRVKLLTGRMHQIRVHFAKQNNPIAGDDKHGNFKKNKMLKKIGIKNLLLVSSSLSFIENQNEKIIKLPLPSDMLLF